MAERRFAVVKAACVLLLFRALVDPAAGFPELDLYKEKGNYMNYGLDHENICHPSSSKIEAVTDLRKDEFKDLAIIVKPSHVFDSWQLKYSKHCRFKIKGPKEDNLFAVVQRMSLRRNGTECLDYVTFKPEESYSTPKKYCGKVESRNGLKSYTSGLNRDETQNSNNHYSSMLDNEIKMIEEFSTKGKITTEIFISKQPLKTGESLDLEIVYTPYKDCSKVSDMSKVWSDPQNRHICINKKFLCDGYVNCASSLCNDEKYNCTTTYREIVSDEIGTKVTISAVTTMFLCFIIFVMCFWICKKHEILCWSQDCSGPSAATGNTPGMSMERGERSATSPPYVSTAPMLEVVVPSSVNDKDLPPSYDSLFPPQTNAANA